MTTAASLAIFPVTYIEREDAEGVMLFNVAGGAKLVKGALSHPAKERM